MTTKLEYCTKDTILNEPPSRSDRGLSQSPSKWMRVMLIRDAALALGVSAYLALVLFDDIESPLISLALIILVTYELFRPHLSRR